MKIDAEHTHEMSWPSPPKPTICSAPDIGPGYWYNEAYVKVLRNRITELEEQVPSSDPPTSTSIARDAGKIAQDASAEIGLQCVEKDDWFDYLKADNLIQSAIDADRREQARLMSSSQKEPPHEKQ